MSNTIRWSDLEPLNPNAPLASGSLTEDFFAAFVGRLVSPRVVADDQPPRASQFRHRGPLELHHRLVSRASRGPRHVGFATGLDTDGTLGTSTEAVGRFAWAFRPDSSRWMVFDRLELKYDEHASVANAFESSRIVNNLHANWQLDPALQLGLQYGVRFVSSTYEVDDYAGVSDIAGMDLRRQMNRRYDLGVHLAALHSWESDVMDYSTGLDVGVTFAKNIWLSVGYNFAGFRDGDFSASRHTAGTGQYLQVRRRQTRILSKI
jgi:hypothetical protein